MEIDVLAPTKKKKALMLGDASGYLEQTCIQGYHVNIIDCLSLSHTSRLKSHFTIHAAILSSINLLSMYSPHPFYISPHPSFPS